MAVPGYWATDDDDPRRVHHNVLVALDEAREVNNGQPSLWAFLFEQLGIRPGERVRHLGCGTGHYIAVAAELVGPHGALTTDSGPGAMLLITRKPRGVRGALPVHGPVHRLPRRTGQRRQP